VSQRRGSDRAGCCVEAETVTVTATAKKVSVKGTSCDAADTFLNLALEPGRDSGANFPLHYECKTGTFHVPAGYRPQVCTKPAKTIRFGRSGL
jgi:hypothetical protein